MYVVDGVIHYCVANMPAPCRTRPRSRSRTRRCPYVLELAAKGAARAVRAKSAALARGVNLWRGAHVHPAVAEALGRAAASGWPGAAAHAERR